jgi:glycosyltransferase involved in cell wall biosynthesis
MPKTFVPAPAGRPSSSLAPLFEPRSLTPHADRLRRYKDNHSRTSTHRVESLPHRMDRPAITTVIATHNRAGLVRRAISSVQAQTYTNIVIAVYDNASTDETAEAVREMAAHDHRIRYFRQTENIGAGENFLYGLRRVETPLFHLLSDDDTIFPDFYSKAVSWLLQFSDAQLAAGGTLEVFENDQFLFAPQAFWPRDGRYAPPDGLDLMLSGFHPSWTTVVFRKDVLRDHGYFDPSLGKVLDLEFLLRIVTRRPYVVFREGCGIFSRHSAAAGESTSVEIMGRFEEMIARLTELGAIEDATKSLVRQKLLLQLRRRIHQVAVKHLLKMEARPALDALSAYRNRYKTTLLSKFIESVALVGVACRPALAVLKPLEALRRRAVAHSSRTAARRHGLGPIAVSFTRSPRKSQGGQTDALESYVPPTKSRNT